MTPLMLVPGQVSLSQLAEIYWQEATVTLDVSCKPKVEDAARRIQVAAAGKEPVYGVNTGFGKLASLKIEAKDTSTLQRNLILSHCCGVGPAVSRRVTRLMMTLKLLSFGRGASGVRWELIELLQQMLARGVTPVIPAQGSVGASGDLAPLAHMTAVIIGAGEAEVNGETLPGDQALRSVGLEPVELGPKEGLAFINARSFQPLSPWLVCMRAGGRHRAPWLFRPCPPMRSWGRPHRCSLKSTRCAGIVARPRPPVPCGLC